MPWVLLTCCLRDLKISLSYMQTYKHLSLKRLLARAHQLADGTKDRIIIFIPKQERNQMRYFVAGVMQCVVLFLVLVGRQAAAFWLIRWLDHGEDEPWSNQAGYWHKHALCCYAALYWEKDRLRAWWFFGGLCADCLCGSVLQEVFSLSICRHFLTYMSCCDRADKRHGIPARVCNQVWEETEYM